MRPGKPKDAKSPNREVPRKKSPDSKGAERKVIANWEPLKEFLHKTVLKDAKPNRMPILEDIFKAALQLVNESPGTLNLKIASTAMKELRYSFKMFYPHRFTPKVTIFGSARVPPKTPLYEMAKQFAQEAVKRKYLVMTGGGPGIMAAGNEGAETGFGLNIRLPFEQDANPYIDANSNLIHYKYFFTRKLFMVKEASAFAFFPGGYGTFDEAFEVLTLLQTGKSNLIPVVMLEPEGFGFWKLFMEFVEKALAEKGFISPLDRRLFHVFHSSEDAMEHIENFYRNYHSMRFVKQGIVIRLKKPLEAEVLSEVNREFQALAGGGKFQQGPPVPEEANEPELVDLTRLVFPFDRKDYGRLRTLVDFINENTV